MTSLRYRRASGDGIREVSNTGIGITRETSNLHQTRLHALQQAFGPAAEQGMSFPSQVFREQVHTVEARLPAKIPQRREPLYRTGAEQVPLAARHLQAPQHQPGDDAAHKSHAGQSLSRTTRTPS